MGETKAQKYVRHRLDGKGPRKAGRLAGYDSAPPSSAEELYQAVDKVRRAPHSMAWVSERLRKLEAERATLKRHEQALELAQRLGVVTS